MKICYRIFKICNFTFVFLFDSMCLEENCMAKNESILLSDYFFRSLFGNEKNKMCLSCLLSEIIKEDYKYIYENILYLNK